MKMRIAALFVWLFVSFIARAQSQSLFFRPPTYAGSGQATTADFNRDGKPDIVSADGTVQLGNGDGTFTTGTPLNLGNVAGSLIASGDFNGDGKPDVVIASFSTTNLYVFLGNGDGTFQVPVTTNIGASLSSIAVADLNGDGKSDVVAIIPATAAVIILLGKGDGT